MNCFRPSMRQPFPFGRAVVRNDAASLPDVGSVRANAPSPVPSMSFGSQRLRCSSVALRTMEPATMPLLTATPTASEGHAAESSLLLRGRDPLGDTLPRCPIRHRAGELALGGPDERSHARAFLTASVNAGTNSNTSATIP